MLRHRQLLIVIAFIAGISRHSAGQSGPVADEFERLHFRSIGPATMSGRISDFAVYEANPAIYYVGTAHGGLWKTTSGGAHFTPLAQDKGLLSVGDVAVSQRNPDVVYVGMGEATNRQSISWGDGMYKSTDGGKTFQSMGLKSSKHIGRILIDPANDDVVLVAAQGPLFGPGGERGVYKTTDGGRTWKQVLRVDEETGANDLAMNPSDPRTIYATTYQRRRTACCMNGGGPGSGVWKSTDGGDSWTRLSGNGLPSGPLGRIAVDVYRKNGNTVYLSIEGPGGGRGGAGGVDSAGGGGGGRGGRGGRGGGGGGADAGATGVYRSDDGGQTWRKTSSNNPRPMYFSQVRIDPSNPERIYMGGVGLQMTNDGGKTFETDAALVTHDDIHAIWVDPGNSEHLLIGTDGGVYESRDMARDWTFMPNLPVGLFYHVGYDMETPYNVCGGMQDNYDWCGPSASRHSRGIFNYDWFQIQGGDGFVAVPDVRDSRFVYTESQDGNMIRRNKVTGESRSIRPSVTNVVNLAPGENTAFRFHWDTPLMLSPNDPGVLLAAANRVFRSTDRGDSWMAISPDLTSGATRDTITTMGLRGRDITISRDDGISQWPAIVALAESPKQPGVYYAGTDDGNVSMSRDGGKTWTNITSRLPGFPSGHAFVSKVAPSRYDAGTVYVTVDNHRENDYDTHIWVSTDFGATFRSLNANLQGEAVKTLTEDQRNADVLYIGTETGIFLTLDRGKTWRRLKANLPTVRVDEITLHPRDNAMLVATHGRALWILDHLEPIQEYSSAQTAAGDAKLFTPPTTLQWKSKDDRNEEFWGHQFFTGENPPTEAVIAYYLKRPVSDLKLRISDGNRTIREIAVPSARNQAGVQVICWDQRVEPIAAPPGLAGGGGRGGGGGGGGGGRGGQPPIAGYPAPLPPVGYLAHDPCAASDSTGGRGGGGGGGGFGGGGALGGPGPMVAPGTYTVALVSGGTTLDAKQIRLIGDPVVQLADAQRKRYDGTLMDLHDIQRRGTEVAVALNSMYPQMAAAALKIKDSTSAPASVKTDFENLTKQYDSVRVKFGVPLNPPAAGGGGGGGRGGGGDPRNALARTGAAKSNIMAVWEAPSPATTKQANDAKSALSRAIDEANAFFKKAASITPTLSQYGVTVMVPPPR